MKGRDRKKEINKDREQFRDREVGGKNQVA